MNTQVVVLLSQIRSARRYKWVSMSIVWLFCLSGWTLVSQMPDQFRAEAKVKIDGAAVVAPVLAERRIEVDELTKAAFVTELLLSNDAMKRIAEMSGTSAQPEEIDEAALENLRACGQS